MDEEPNRNTAAILHLFASLIEKADQATVNACLLMLACGLFIVIFR